MPDTEDTKRILIVDDESVIADTLVLIFNREGYAARAVYSAEEALGLVPEWQPHLALIDVRLPGMNGVDLAVQLRSDYPACCIALFAGQAATSDLGGAARESGHDFEVLEKPVHPGTLLALASRLLQRAENG
jgi:DNA-binding response OmpR family regulator